MERKLKRTIAIIITGLLAFSVAPAVFAGHLPASPTAEFLIRCELTGIVKGPGVEPGDENVPLKDIEIVALGKSGGALLHAYNSTTTAANGSYSMHLAQGTWRLVAVDPAAKHNPTHVEDVTIPTGLSCPSDPVVRDISMTKVTQVPPIGGPDDPEDPKGTLTINLLERLQAPGTGPTLPIPDVAFEVRKELTSQSPADNGCGSRTGDSVTKKTDANGQAIFTLAPGKYFICFDEGQSGTMDYTDTAPTGGPDRITIVEDQTSISDWEWTKRLVKVKGMVMSHELSTRTDPVPVKDSLVTFDHDRYCSWGTPPAGVSRYVCEKAAEAADGSFEFMLPLDSANKYRQKADSPANNPTIAECNHNYVRTSSSNANPKDTTCDISLTQAATSIFGTLVDVDGNTVAGANVKFAGTHSINLDNDETTTESDGKFIKSLATDAFTVSITSGATLSRLCIDTTDGFNRDLGTITHGAGQATASGVVQDLDTATTAPLAGATVTFEDASGDTCRVTTDANGEYAFQLPAESFTATADKKAYKKSGPIAADLTAGNLTLPPIAIARETGEILGNVKEDYVNADINAESVHIGCSSATTGDTVVGITDDKGNYIITAPFAADYSCNVVAPSKDSYSAEPDVTDVVVEAGKKTTKIDFVFQRILYTISGTVKDVTNDEPVEGAIVQIRNVETGVVVSAPTAEDGTYSTTIKYIQPKASNSDRPDRTNTLAIVALADEFVPGALVWSIGPGGTSFQPARAGSLDFLLVPEPDRDGDSIPDLLEPHICGLQSEDPAIPDGSCSGDDYTAPDL